MGLNWTMISEVFMLYWIIGMAMLYIAIRLKSFEKKIADSSKRNEAIRNGTYVIGPFVGTIMIAIGAFSWPLFFIYFAQEMKSVR